MTPGQTYLCHECGYDMTGSLAAGHDTCPECGVRVTYATARTEPRRAGLRWGAMLVAPDLAWSIALVGALTNIVPLARAVFALVWLITAAGLGTWAVLAVARAGGGRTEAAYAAAGYLLSNTLILVLLGAVAVSLL